MTFYENRHLVKTKFSQFGSGLSEAVHPSIIPSRDELDRLLRYEGAIERQFYKALHQLERLQRLEHDWTSHSAFSLVRLLHRQEVNQHI